MRGLVLAQHNMEEISILEHPVFREEMSKLGFAEIWVSPSPNILKFYDFSRGAAEITNGYLKDLADASGYPEINNVPVVAIGHSAAASWPYYFAAKNPDRTLACVSVSGQWPYVRGDNFAPDIWSPEQSIDFIPCLETMGEYEAAETWAVEGLKERKDHPLIPLSMLAVPGEGHFASSDLKTAFIAFYIKKSVQYRMPKHSSKGKCLKLIQINPAKTGWLAERWHSGTGPAEKAAPVGKYKGNAEEAFWFFDEETVREVERYGKAFRCCAPQLVGFLQQGKIVAQRNSHIQVHMKFIPQADGVTFYLGGQFYDSVPAVSSRLSNWSGLKAGSVIGHSDDIKAINIERICGPFIKVSDTVFRLQLDRGVDLTADKLALTFAVKHPGDTFYKPAVQQGEIIIPSRLKEGNKQEIYFKELHDLKADDKDLSIHLQATSSSGLPVNFYVLEGPGEIDSNRLVIKDIPPKAKYPLKVTVVAWQYGQDTAPEFQSAIPCVRSFYIKNKS